MDLSMKKLGKISNFITHVNKLFLQLRILNLLLKLEAKWCIQYTKWRPSTSKPTCSDCKADNMFLLLSVIEHKFHYGVTCYHNNWNNYINVSFVSPSTIANIKRNILWFPSYAIDV